MQSVLAPIFPARCIGCGALVETDFALCGPCWRETPFIGGLVCDGCGAPLPGAGKGEAIQCDDCLADPRPWVAGRSALLYRGAARKLILGLKHGDRQDLVRPLADWMLRAGRPILAPGMLVVPVPMHWWRLFRRRYNQAALLSARVAGGAGLAHCPDLLVRRRGTGSQNGRDRAGRFANVAGAIAVHPRRAGRLAGRHVLVVDDVMTSGATLSAAAQACREAGAAAVSALVLARVAEDA